MNRRNWLNAILALPFLRWIPSGPQRSQWSTNPEKDRTGWVYGADPEMPNEWSVVCNADDNDALNRCNINTHGRG